MITLKNGAIHGDNDIGGINEKKHMIVWLPENVFA